MKLLIVEDDPSSRNLLKKLLVSAGYEVVSAENGREAQEILEKDCFRIVITDWMMPEMDGVELCRTIRSRNFERYIFIIILTAKDTKDDIVAGLEAGADDYLIKPFHSAELITRLSIIERYLEIERSLKEANEKIKILSITDPLTGIYNRGYMDERLPQEMARAKRYGHTLSLIMSDIDHFKKINDIFGHQVGDKVLREFVDCMESGIRNGIDWITRYGGEEFLIILPETDVELACRVAERLRRLVAEKITYIEGKEIRITASFGVSGFNPSQHNDIVSYESLIGQADKRLYQAKKEGRNRVKGGFHEEDISSG